MAFCFCVALVSVAVTESARCIDIYTHAILSRNGGTKPCVSVCRAAEQHNRVKHEIDSRRQNSCSTTLMPLPFVTLTMDEKKTAYITLARLAPAQSSLWPHLVRHQGEEVIRLISARAADPAKREGARRSHKKPKTQIAVIAAKRDADSNLTVQMLGKVTGLDGAEIGKF